MQKIDLRKKKILVTGGIGFIGANLILELLKSVEPVQIISIDSKNDYYDPSIKDWRLAEIKKEAEKHPASSFTFVLGNIADKALVEEIFQTYEPDLVVNLAAQAGVR